MIHAAIPDGEDEIRKRLTERIAWHRRRCYLSKQDCDDAAIVLARLTALEAENAALKAEVARLKPYKDELLKIAEAVGEKADPFAAWETIEPWLERTAQGEQGR